MSSESRELLRNEVVSSSRRSKCMANGTFVCVSVVVVLILGIGVLSGLAAGPLHAQCAVKWNISIPCFDVSSLLVNQIKEWTTEICHGKNQKCLYSLASVNGDRITATHTTPIMRFVDDLTFNLSSPGADSCIIQGYSVSRSWYAILDSGTNYRNMYNLMRGRDMLGLVAVAGSDDIHTVFWPWVGQCSASGSSGSMVALAIISWQHQAQVSN